jgi:hypothetical protein
MKSEGHGASQYSSKVRIEQDLDHIGTLQVRWAATRPASDTGCVIEVATLRC